MYCHRFDLFLFELHLFDLHLVVDNYATHKHPKVKEWLKRHPRFSFQFTPTSASRINLVERFFGLITEDSIRRGVFRSVADLDAAIENYLEHHNAAPKPLIWTAKTADILEKSQEGHKCQSRNTRLLFEGYPLDRVTGRRQR